MDLISPRRSREGRWIVAPAIPGGRSGSSNRSSYRRQRSLERRRRLLVGLIAAVVVSLMWALLLSGSWTLHALIVLFLGLYVVVLLEAKRRRGERATKVRKIGGSARRDEEEFKFYEPVRASGGRR